MTLKEVRDRIEYLLDTNDKPKASEMIQWLGVITNETMKEGPAVYVNAVADDDGKWKWVAFAEDNNLVNRSDISYHNRDAALMEGVTEMQRQAWRTARVVCMQ